MKAVIHKKYGAPKLLKIEKIDMPVIGSNEVLVKTHATTINRTDCAMLRAKPFIMRFFTGLTKPKNNILGTDFAGLVVAIGDNVNSLKIGDRVFGFDDSGLSSHAQYLSFNKNKAIAVIPDKITYTQAAGSLEGVHYAYNFINKVKLQKGQKVIVNGGTGAIGSAAIQLLKHFEIKVTAVCGTEYMDRVKSIGAEKVIDYTKKDFTTTNEKYDFVFDAVGKSSFAKCKPLLNSKGIYISSELGFMAENIFYALFTPLFRRKKVIFPIPVNQMASVQLAKKLLEDGEFDPLIDRKYKLESIVDAFTYVESGQKIGNVILDLGNNNL